MKYAICNETFQDWPFAKAFEYAKELGYDALNLHRLPFMRMPIKSLLNDVLKCERWQKPMSSIIGLHWLLAKTEGYYLTTPDDDIRKRTAEYIAELARLCSDLGGYHGARITPTA